MAPPRPRRSRDRGGGRELKRISCSDCCCESPGCIFVSLFLFQWHTGIYFYVASRLCGSVLSIFRPCLRNIAWKLDAGETREKSAGGLQAMRSWETISAQHQVCFCDYHDFCYCITTTIHLLQRCKLLLMQLVLQISRVKFHFLAHFSIEFSETDDLRTCWSFGFVEIIWLATITTYCYYYYNFCRLCAFTRSDMASGTTCSVPSLPCVRGAL